MGNWPQVVIDLPEGYSQCFGCGQDNPIGLKLKFEPDGKGIKAIFTPDERYQGWPGYLHGGIVGCLLDEVMSNAATSQGVRCVTARIETRLKRLIPINIPLVITSHVTRKTRKVIDCASAVRLQDGTIVAEGNATHFVADIQKDDVKAGSNDR
jgi:acyl-coenzyme A thioesterase PaaI-like protein